MFQRQPSIARTLLPIALCVPLTGCSLSARMGGGFEDPIVQLQASRVESISLSATHVLFELLVHNPNAFALRLDALRYRLTVSQRIVAEGMADAGAAIPARASAPLNVPLEVSLDVLRNAAGGAMTLGEIPYDLEVWLSLDSWFQRHEVRLTASSVLRLNLPLGLTRSVAFPVNGWQS